MAGPDRRRGAAVPGLQGVGVGFVGELWGDDGHSRDLRPGRRHRGTTG